MTIRTLALRLGTAFCLAALPGFAGPAQDDAAQAPEPAADHARKLAQLVENYDDAYAEFLTAYRAATDDAGRQAAYDHLDPELTLAFRDLAEEAKGTETAAKSWMQVIRSAQMTRTGYLVKVAVNTLTAEHMDSPEMAGLCSLLPRYQPDSADATLRKLLAESPHDSVKATALFQIASLANEAAGADEAKQKAARALFAELKERFGTLADDRAGTWGARAEGEIFALDNLAVGKLAPEIEANDLHGVQFRLSDYRGKVVLLDFWGNW